MRRLTLTPLVVLAALAAAPAAHAADGTIFNIAGSVQGAGGQHIFAGFDKVILAIPAAQAMALLNASGL
ncbi:MAG: hypothetical protein ACEQSX_10175, partial [Baekduiaceae bacterium]